MPNRRDLAMIHIAQKELGLDDASYRGILRERYQRDSAADLTPRQAADLIALFRKKGWRPASPGQLGLIHVLWHRLQTCGAIVHGDDDALNAYVNHYTGRRGLHLLTVHEASRVIEMLKKWLEREGAGNGLQ